VDFDWFAQYVIDTYNFIQEDKEIQIRDLFLAVDVSNTGFINQQSFEMMMKVFHYKSAKYTNRLFEEYSVNMDPNNLFS
jgi:Ca2+-binding EF-hand superfamily protein